MTDQEDKFNLGKIVFDDNNQERKSWAYLGQTCSRSLIVFLSQLFVILLRWTKSLNLVDSLVMEIFIWTLCFVTPKYLDCMRYLMMLLEQCGHIRVKVQAITI